MPRPQVQQKRSFNRSEAKFGQTYNNTRLVYGRYLVALTRLHDHDGHKGHRFWYGGEIIAAAPLPSVPTNKQPAELTAVGVAFEDSIYPDGAKGNEHLGGRMSQPMARQLEAGKIFQVVAAAFGYYNQQADSLTDEDFQMATTQEQNEITKLRGRLVVVEHVYHQNKEGKDSGFNEVHPYIRADYPEFENVEIPAWCSLAPVVEEDESAPEQPQTPPAKKATKPAPSKTAKPSFEEAAQAAGYYRHLNPDYAAEWFEREDLDEPVHIAELMTQLGY